MRVVLQRVSWAQVVVGGRLIARIDAGLLALVAVAHDDDPARVEALAGKTARARLFHGDERPFAAPVGADPARAILCVSQFTLLGDLRRGNRPSWSRAAPPERAEPLFEAYQEELRAAGLRVASGVFGAHMEVSLLNDGPVTLVLDSDELERPRR